MFALHCILRRGLRIIAIGLVWPLAASAAYANCSVMNDLATIQNALATLHLAGEDLTQSDVAKYLNSASTTDLLGLSGNADIAELQALYDLIEVSRVYSILAKSASTPEASRYITSPHIGGVLQTAARRIARYHCVQANLKLRVIPITAPEASGSKQGGAVLDGERPYDKSLFGLVTMTGLLVIVILATGAAVAATFFISGWLRGRKRRSRRFNVHIVTTIRDGGEPETFPATILDLSCNGAKISVIRATGPEDMTEPTINIQDVWHPSRIIWSNARKARTQRKRRRRKPARP